MRTASRPPNKALPAEVDTGSASGNAPTKNPRISPLAVLPVFFDLRGKRAVVIGGSEAAAWKIELLAAAGARVDVYAEAVCEELRDLASSAPLPLEGRGRGWGSISDPLDHPLPQSLPSRGREATDPQPPRAVTLHPRPWTQADLAGAALAIADLDADIEAQAFVAAAKAACVPYNVIDRPEFCQFQFGAIVNRSPVVVGISTAGAAPILGQAVRRRIETLLPQTLSTWAQLAATIRDTVMEKLAAGPQRRAFWERLADNAFGNRAPGPADQDLAFAAGPRSGRVTLVGAGPGEADLLTIKAVRALQSADVILFDDRVPAEVLELARREARRLPIGKSGWMMLTLARQGKHVVRLTTGDPGIFGRDREEIETLERHGIAVSVVPGIALPARMGRGHNPHFI